MKSQPNRAQIKQRILLSTTRPVHSPSPAYSHRTNYSKIKSQHHLIRFPLRFHSLPWPGSCEYSRNVEKIGLNLPEWMLAISITSWVTIGSVLLSTPRNNARRSSLTYVNLFDFFPQNCIFNAQHVGISALFCSSSPASVRMTCYWCIFGGYFAGQQFIHYALQITTKKFIGQKGKNVAEKKA